MAPTRVRNSPRSQPSGYTLIELLVVMGIIVALVSLVFPVTAALKKKRMIAVAQAELKQVETAIQAYQSKIGFYPPDNPGNPVTNQLYFELSGTYLDVTNAVFITLDGSSRIPVSRLPLLYNFGALLPGPSTPVGFANSSKTLRGTDQSSPAVNFLTGLRPNQIGQMVVGKKSPFNPPVNALLVCSVKWTADWQWVSDRPAANPRASQPGLNPWRYVSNSPTNNPGSYDLWVDLAIGSSVYRVSNWSKDPQVVPPPWP